MLCISGIGLSNLIFKHLRRKEEPSISFFDHDSDDDNLDLDYPDLDNLDLYGTYNSIKELLEDFSEENKKITVAAFEQALIDFLYRYTLCEAVINLENPIEGYLEERIELLLDKSQYLLIQEKGEYPREPDDFRNYFQLGKRGGCISPDKIKESIAADRASLTEVLSMDELNFTQKMLELSKRTLEGVLKSLKERIHAY